MTRRAVRDLVVIMDTIPEEEEYYSEVGRSKFLNSPFLNFEHN